MFSLPVCLTGQIPEILPAEGETVAFALHRTDAWLDTPAEPTQFIVIKPMSVSRIITLHRKGAGEGEPGEIKLVNVTGDFSIGSWKAVEKEAPEDGNLVYWIIYPDAAIPPGRYLLIDSAPDTWINTALTARQGIAWVFRREEVQ